MATRAHDGDVPRTYAALTLDALRKGYDGRTVVDGVPFSVEDGEIFAILGPNGADKTTAAESIAGLRLPDSGRIGMPTLRRAATGRIDRGRARRSAAGRRSRRAHDHPA
jgi:ABC-2 type transport system ATP-binding protein